MILALVVGIGLTIAAAAFAWWLVRHEPGIDDDAEYMPLAWRHERIRGRCDE